VVQKKPKASRDKSSEIFLMGRGIKNPVKNTIEEDDSTLDI